MPNTKPTPESEIPEFHITVGGQPTTDLSLEKELQMVKAAILYADRVKLYSLKVPSILAIARFKDIPKNLRLDFLERVLPYISQDKAQKISESLKEYRTVLSKERLDDSDLQLKEQFEKTVEQTWEAIAETTSQFVKDSQIEQINTAVKAGVLDLHPFDQSDEDHAALDTMIEHAANAFALKSKGRLPSVEQDKEWVQKFVENVSNSVSDVSTYPLLDSETGNLLSTGLVPNSSGIVGLGMERGKQTELAKYLLEQLPLFEKASVDEILDIRRELDKPLTRFRGAIMDFSGKIKAAPWNKDFPYEANKIYIHDVQPAMLDIEEAVQANKFLYTMIQKFKQKSAIELPKGELISLGIANISSLSKELAASIGFGIASATIIYDAYQEWLKKKKAVEHHKLYFYYGLGKRLGR